MATPPQPMPQGGPPGPPQGAPPTGQVLQLVAVITKASDALAKVFPASAEDVSEIQNRMQKIQQKITETQTPTQPQAPPI